MINILYKINTLIYSVVLIIDNFLIGLLLFLKKLIKISESKYEWTSAK